MENFKHSIKSQQFVLNAWDMAAAFTNIPYIYYFKNTNGNSDADFMPSDRLRASFLKTLEDFAILAGHVKTDVDGRAWIDVNADELNMPEYLESHSMVHFRDLEDAGYDWNAFPGKIATTNAFPIRGTDGVIKLANVNIVRLCENSGLILFVSISHYVVDGAGYCAFVNRWAEVCCWMQNSAVEGTLQTCNYTFDRSVIDHCLPQRQTPLTTAMASIYNSPSYFGYFLAWVSPEVRGDIIRRTSQLVDVAAHVFHVSSASLKALRVAITNDMSDVIHITDNDILTVLISHAISKGKKDDANGSNSRGFLDAACQRAIRALTGQSTNFHTMMLLDIRPRVNGLAQAQYTGNSVTCIPVVNQLNLIAQDNPSPKDLADLCTQTRLHIRDASAERLSELNRIISGNRASFGHVLANGLTNMNKVILSNQSRFSLYQNDFGNGIPAWVSPIPTFHADFASILPVHPSSDGYNLYLTVETHVMQSILRNGLWNTYVDLVY